MECRPAGRARTLAAGEARFLRTTNHPWICGFGRTCAVGSGGLAVVEAQRRRLQSWIVFSRCVVVYSHTRCDTAGSDSTFVEGISKVVSGETRQVQASGNACVGSLKIPSLMLTMFRRAAQSMTITKASVRICFSGSRICRRCICSRSRYPSRKSTGVSVSHSMVFPPFPKSGMAGLKVQLGRSTSSA